MRQNRGFIKDDVIEDNILDSDFCVFLAELHSIVEDNVENVVLWFARNVVELLPLG